MFISRVLQQKTDWYSDYLQDNIKDLLDTTFEIPSDYKTTVTQVTADYIARPDLLAHDIYGDEMYADILCKLNGISNPFELNEGMYILVPDMDFLNKFIVQPSQEWHNDVATGSGGNSSSSKPSAKLRSDRRKPNQAVIGDKRFNIDPISKIVIY